MGNLYGIFKPKTHIELSDAINLYCDNKDEGIKKYGIIGEWDVSLINDMSDVFYNKKYFNYDISNWNVSNVTNMSCMFYNCESFNQLLNNWNVSNVTNMERMFYGCINFNQPLNNWNVFNITDMSVMFEYCENFNQSLNNWDVSNVIDMKYMFNGCINFNQPLNNWDVSNVTSISYMFNDCYKFNQPLSEWDVSNTLSEWDVFNIMTISDDIFSESDTLNQRLILWDDENYENSCDIIEMLDTIVLNPCSSIQKNTIINNILNTSVINYIYSYQKEIMTPKYKKIFEGYKMPYKIVNYKILCLLKHLGIKMNDAINYNRFNNKLLVDLHLNKKNTIVSNLIKHIKETDIERYNCLGDDLAKLFSKRVNKKVNIIIYNNNILLSNLEE